VTSKHTDTGQRATHLFGPVPSRRLGRSLGIDLVPLKTCSYDCLYCQLGHTTCKTCRRAAYIPADAVIAELQAWLAGKAEADYLTLSGSGEPTLNNEIGKIAAWLKDHTSIPVAVLTNGSLLGEPDVRRALQPVDVLVPSLDAATPATFELLNRPHHAVGLERVLDGLAAMRQGSAGEMWVEVMLVQGFNDGPGELEAIRQVIDRVQPDRVQLNTVVRPPADHAARAVSDETLIAARELLGPQAEVIAPFRSRKPASDDDEQLAQGIVELLRRRPCTLADIAEGLGAHRNWVLKHIERLLSDRTIRAESRHGATFYAADRPSAP
jgi:wyosine [tRNA(Phe)-imidazoG37] synthetase (radical SAM superfamily)